LRVLTLPLLLFSLLRLLFRVQSGLFLDFQFLITSFSIPPVFSIPVLAVIASADTKSVKVETVIAFAFTESIGLPVPHRLLHVITVKYERIAILLLSPSSIGSSDYALLGQVYLFKYHRSLSCKD
jgi:hypothetical protein